MVSFMKKHISAFPFSILITGICRDHCYYGNDSSH